MARFILIHGAFRGGWAWDRVRPGLEAEGHQVLNPTLSLGGEVTLSGWASDIADLIDEASPAKDLCIVGHSQGGIVALAAVGQRPDAVRRLILLDSPIPTAGQTAADVLPHEVRHAYGDPPREAWLAPTPTGDPWVDSRLVSAPVAPAYDPVDSGGRAATVDTAYVFCSRSGPGVPATYSRKAFDAAGRAYRLIDADHDAPLLQPALVVELLLELTPTGSTA